MGEKRGDKAWGVGGETSALIGRDLARKILSGDDKSAARLITLLEEDNEEGYKILSEVFPFTGKAHIIGITGPPGSGKSTLAGKLAVLFTETGKRVGIIAVDPSSVKQRGALLGDRVRMKEAEKLPEVFIRSMANRTYPGGMAKATAGAVYVLEALGKNIIIVESVGVGQSEKSLFCLADTIITVFTPDYGDEIQLLKAGLMEIGDVVVVNKSDNAGSDQARHLLQTYVEQGDEKSWQVPVLLCRADRGKGVDEIARAAEAHLGLLAGSKEGVDKKREQRVQYALMLLKEELISRFMAANTDTPAYGRWRDAVSAGAMDPYQAVRQLVEIDAKRRQERNRTPNS